VGFNLLPDFANVALQIELWPDRSIGLLFVLPGEPSACRSQDSRGVTGKIASLIGEVGQIAVIVVASGILTFLR
jgi:hypothetical protein